MKEFLYYQRLTLLWALFVLVMCSMSMGSVSETHSFFPGFDKLVHCGFFFVFVVLACNGLIRQQNTARVTYKVVTIVFILAFLFGGLIEILQSTVFTWRDGDWNDLFADTVGAGMGSFSVLVTVIATRYVKR